VSKFLHIWVWIWMETHVMPDMDGQHQLLVGRNSGMS